MSGERGEVVESTEQERIQNEEEVFILTFMRTPSSTLVTKTHQLLYTAQIAAD